jgi:Leucine-rich repeat (LRR) protein
MRNPAAFPVTVLLVVPLTCMVTHAAAQQVNERLILLDFYDATGGPSWNDNDGWEDGHTNVDSDYCDWTGVICTGDADLDLFEHRNLQQQAAEANLDGARVMGLDLSNNFLQGRTPASVWQLPLLQYFNVDNNQNLQVDFSAVNQAPQLSVVKASATSTTSLAGLDHASLTLNIVHLTGCPLRSAIPKELLALTNLRDLQLSACQLQGQLTDLAALTNLRNLNLFDNQLRGSLPNEMIQMIRLERFSISRNMLTGNLDVVDAWVEMQELYVAENQFRGPLPSLSAMPRLSRAVLNQNMLTGSIPENFLAAITTWKPNYEEDADWIRIVLSDNQLTGTIPESLDDLEDLGMDFRWNDNRFDNISEALCDNDYWNRGAVKNFACDGLACPPGTFSELGHASHQYPCQPCDAAEYFGATICVQEGDRSALLALYGATRGDHWNNNTGWKNDTVVNVAAASDICDWYGVECYQAGDTDDDTRVGRVSKIRLAGNNLVGGVPKEIFTMEFLHTFDVARNPELVVSLVLLGESSEIRNLDISETATVNLDGLEMASDWFAHFVANGLNLGGTLPTQILNLTELQLLSMVQCQFIGTLPTELGMLTKLNELYLFDNNLRGAVPLSIGNMAELRLLSLAHNQLTGAIPTTLEALTKLEALSLADQLSKGGGIHGPLPTFRFQPNLKLLHLSNNMFEGTVPVQLLEGIVDLQAVLKVNLANNRLTGQVSPENDERRNANIQCLTKPYCWTLAIE